MGHRANLQIAVLGELRNDLHYIRAAVMHQRLERFSDFNGICAFGRFEESGLLGSYVDDVSLVLSRALAQFGQCEKLLFSKAWVAEASDHRLFAQGRGSVCLSGVPVEVREAGPNASSLMFSSGILMFLKALVRDFIIGAGPHK